MADFTTILYNHPCHCATVAPFVEHRWARALYPKFPHSAAVHSRKSTPGWFYHRHSHNSIIQWPLPNKLPTLDGHNWGMAPVSDVSVALRNPRPTSSCSKWTELGNFLSFWHLLSFCDPWPTLSTGLELKQTQLGDCNLPCPPAWKLDLYPPASKRVLCAWCKSSLIELTFVVVAFGLGSDWHGATVHWSKSIGRK